MWYMVQTQEGREQELVDAIRGSEGDEFGKHLGERCFFLQREAVWRREGRCIKHLDVLFPGCVFVESDSEAGFSQRLEEFLSRLENARPGLCRTSTNLDGTADNGAKVDCETVVPEAKDVRMTSGSVVPRMKDVGMASGSAVTGTEFASGSEAGGGFSKRGNAITRAGEISGLEADGTSRPESGSDSISKAAAGLKTGGGSGTAEGAGGLKTTAIRRSETEDRKSSAKRNDSGAPESSTADARLRGEAFVDPELLSNPAGFSSFRRSEYAAGEKESSEADGGKTNVADATNVTDATDAGNATEEWITNARIPVYPIREEDQRILESLLDGDREYIVRLSPVEVDEKKDIVECGGALRHYRGEIVRKRIRLRYVIVRIPFYRGLRDVLLGIRLEGDDEISDKALAEIS